MSAMHHVLIIFFSVSQNQLDHITKMSVFSMLTNTNTNTPVIMSPIHVSTCKQVCFSKEKHARGIFAAVEDLFNPKLFGDIFA
jgi:hypothetical protein